MSLRYHLVTIAVARVLVRAYKTPPSGVRASILGAWRRDFKDRLVTIISRMNVSLVDKIALLNELDTV